jgi:hypothetical protein
MTFPSQYTAQDNPLPTVPGTRLVTSGHGQLIVNCPQCGEQHRHLGLGLRRSPCGCWYVVGAPSESAGRGLKAA